MTASEEGYCLQAVRDREARIIGSDLSLPFLSLFCCFEVVLTGFSWDAESAKV